MHIGNSLWGLITGSDKKQKYPDQQAKFLGRVGNFTIIYPYGSHCDLPSNALIKQVAEDAAIPVTIDRPDGMAQGEPVFFHPVKMGYIVFKNNGDIDVFTEYDVNVECNNLNAIATTSVNITAPITTINGNLTVTGDTALAANVTSNGKNISDTHVHGGVTTGGSNTGAPA